MFFCSRHRHVPKAVYRASQIKTEMKQAQRRKDDRRRKHSTAYDANPYVAERKRHIVHTKQ